LGSRALLLSTDQDMLSAKNSTGVHEQNFVTFHPVCILTVQSLNVRYSKCRMLFVCVYS
jgi:hypothetical protein